MTDGIELNCGLNEITEVLSSEAENEQVESAFNLSEWIRENQRSRESPFNLSEWIRENQRSRESPFNISEWIRENQRSIESPFCLSERIREIQQLDESPLRRLNRRLSESIMKMFYYLIVLIEIAQQGTIRSRVDRKLSKQKSKRTWSDQSLALLITVMGLFAGAAYMVLFSFHDAFPISAAFKGVNLSIWELLTFPRAATDDFLVITTVTTTFILSMGMNTIAVCIFFRKFIRGTFLTILSLFTIAAFSLSFFAMLSKFVPHHITIAGGNLRIPATFIVIFYDIYLIILVCAFAYTVQWWQNSRRKQDAVVEPESVV